MISLSSLGSLGRSKILSSFSSSAILALDSANSSLAKSFNSSSDSSSRIAKLSSTFCLLVLYSVYAEIGMGTGGTDALLLSGETCKKSGS